MSGNKKVGRVLRKPIISYQFEPEIEAEFVKLVFRQSLTQLGHEGIPFDPDSRHDADCFKQIFTVLLYLFR